MTYTKIIKGWGNYPQQESQVLTPSSTATLRTVIQEENNYSTWNGAQLW